jgi:hypothetical protein
MARIKGSDAQLADVLGKLFAGHGVRTAPLQLPRPSWLARLFGATTPAVLTFPDHPGFQLAGFAGELPGSHPLLSQTDIILGLPNGCGVVESFAGMGDTPQAQIADAVAKFALSSFHVLLTAFFDKPVDGGAVLETWDAGGERRTVVLGPMVSRFGEPPTDLRWRDQYLSAVRAAVPPGVHWVQLYQMRQGNESAGGSVLLDNEPWPELERAVAGFDWPPGEPMYDARIFLVVGPAEAN